MDQIKAALLSTELLQEWATYSSRKRVALIWSQFNIKVSNTTLMSYYRQHGITFRKVGYRYKLRDTIDQHRQAQYDFVIKLLQELQKGSNIVYIDETSTHLWEHRVKIWQPKKEPLL